MVHLQSISDFNKNKWFYIERLKTNQSLFKLGTQKIKKNNVLIVELNKKGILKNKKIIKFKNMNDLNILKIQQKKILKKIIIYICIFFFKRKN